MRGIWIWCIVETKENELHWLIFNMWCMRFSFVFAGTDGFFLFMESVNLFIYGRPMK